MKKMFLTLQSFLKQHLGASGPEAADVEALRLEVTELRTKVEQLTEENNDLKTKVRNDFSFCVPVTVSANFICHTAYTVKLAFSCLLNTINI